MAIYIVVASACAGRVLGTLLGPAVWSFLILARLTGGMLDDERMLMVSTITLEAATMTVAIYGSARITTTLSRRSLGWFAVSVSVLASPSLWSDIEMRVAQVGPYTPYWKVKVRYCEGNANTVASSAQHLVSAPELPKSGKLDDLLKYDTFRSNLKRQLDYANKTGIHKITPSLLCLYRYRIDGGFIELVCPDHPTTDIRLRLP